MRKCYNWMCYALKYGIWNVRAPAMEAVNTLVSGGYAPLAAMILASRGMTSVEKAGAYLDCNANLYDPYLMRDMVPAVERVRSQVLLWVTTRWETADRWWHSLMV